MYDVVTGGFIDGLVVVDRVIDFVVRRLDGIDLVIVDLVGFINCGRIEEPHRVGNPGDRRVPNVRLDDRITAHLLEYELDGFFDWHMDLGAGPTASRKLTMVTFLTPPEEFTGGELLFMDGGPPMRPAQGTTAIFPSYLLHKVNPVTQGRRFTLVSWLHGPCFS